MDWTFPQYCPNPFTDKIQEYARGMYWFVYGPLLTVTDYDGSTICTAEYVHMVCTTVNNLKGNGAIVDQIDHWSQEVAKRMGYEYAFAHFDAGWYCVRNIKWTDRKKIDKTVEKVTYKEAQP